jgi:hypothetical protein
MHSQGVALDAGELARLIYAFDYNEDGFISRQVRLRPRGKADRRKERNERLDAHKQAHKQTNEQTNKRRRKANRQADGRTKMQATKASSEHCARADRRREHFEPRGTGSADRTRRPAAGAVGRSRFALAHLLMLHGASMAWHGMAFRVCRHAAPRAARRSAL